MGSAIEEEKVRLYVGGLASEISSSDLQDRFAPLGSVQSVSLVPAKAGGSGHRGFAYVDFVPATDASLRKLFSSYNGCKWRGGLLRIEKAKEHFSSRLQREWVVEAASLAEAEVLVRPVQEVQQGLPGIGRLKKTDANKVEMTLDGLKIFFPSLGKLKTVPLKGLGKHKRSFQRVESSPLHRLSTCACKNHSGPCVSDGHLLEASMHSEGDDIAIEIKKERERQLELLSRLFPSDIPSTSLEHQEIVELDNSHQEGITDNGVKLQSEGKTSRIPGMEERQKSKRCEHPEQRPETPTIVGKPRDEPIDLRTLEESGEKVENGLKDDMSEISLDEECTNQLELMHQLFPLDAQLASELEPVIPSATNGNKKKRKGRESGEDAEEFKSKSKRAQTRMPAGSKKSMMDTDDSLLDNPDVTLGDSLAAGKFERQGRQMLTSVPMMTTKEILDNSEQVENPSEEFPSVPVIKEQEMQLPKSSKPAMAEDLLEEDLEMTLNLGDDSMSITIAEEQERRVLVEMSSANLLDASNQGSATELEGTRINGTSKAEVFQHTEDLCEDSEDSHDEQVVLETTESKIAECSEQTSEFEGSIKQQSDQPSKWDALGELCRFRNSDGPVQSEGSGPNVIRLQLGENCEDKSSKPVHVLRVDERKEATHQQTEVENSPGEHISGLSMPSQKLTRAAWKSLVGETGRVVFSLRQLTGSTLPNVPSGIDETKPAESTYDHFKSSGNASSSRYEQVSLKPPLHADPGSSKSLQTKVGTLVVNNTPAVTPIVPSGDSCPFMKSENAEEEWLATKSELRSDYRAKHKHAARNMKKLRGKRT